mmetsp:Transcript_24743/g.35972  ORF Transcript_24743/g.35972 Transcript_24743/m.35972 type:complete len:371 (-) Transcript_24743:434-1546(-)
MKKNKVKSSSSKSSIEQGIRRFDRTKLKQTETIVRKTSPIKSKMVLDSDPAPRFDLDDPNMLVHLEDYGYAIVKCVADEPEVHTARDLFWKFLEENAGMDRNKPKTWDDARFSRVGMPQVGILDMGQSDANWFVRLLPRVKSAFEAIWKTPDLIVSFDGGNAFRPHHAPGQTSKRTSGGWWHVDQGHGKRGVQAIQGFVSLYDGTAETGGLCVIPGSHRGHDGLLAQVPNASGDFVMVPSPSTNPIIRDGKLIVCKAGDLVLWDSRTIHCNNPSLTTPTEERGYPHDQLLRAAIYVCMTPRYKASSNVITMRRKAFLAGVGTSHWPHEFHPKCPGEIDTVFQKFTDKKVEEAFVDLNVREEQRSLIGDAW